MKDKKALMLTPQEKVVLKRLSLSQLLFLSELSTHKEYDTFIAISNYFLNQEKNYFFLENELSTDPNKLYAKHALVRGELLALQAFMKVIEGAKYELELRTPKKKGE